MKKLVFILSAMLLLIGTMDVQAQWGKKLLKKAGESAKRATERNVERKVEPVSYTHLDVYKRQGVSW